mmetsp:Transcript_31021/g.74425  ORF Transcript_31021/g.74425 Transcript_31021/m.74425 type:complete len:201 (-) Transcript_31021:531-1133(-)
MVHRARGHKVSAVVERDAPYRLRVIGEGCDALALHEVPNLDRPVPRRRRQVRCLRVEVDARDPALMPLARQDQLSVGHAPHLPGVVIRGGGHDGLLRVEGQRADRGDVRLEGLSQLVLVYPLGLEFGVEVGVLSVLERRQRRFCGGQTPFGGAAQRRRRLASRSPALLQQRVRSASLPVQRLSRCNQRLLQLRLERLHAP